MDSLRAALREAGCIVSDSAMLEALQEQGSIDVALAKLLVGYTCQAYRLAG